MSMRLNVSRLAVAVAGYLDPAEGQKKAALAEALREADIDPESFEFNGPSLTLNQRGDRYYIADSTVIKDGTSFSHVDCRQWRRQGEGRWFSVFNAAIAVLLQVAKQHAPTEHGNRWLVANGITTLNQETLRDATNVPLNIGGSRQSVRHGLGGVVYALWGERDAAGELLAAPEGTPTEQLQHPLTLPAEAAAKVQEAYSAVQRARRQPPSDEELQFLRNLSSAFDMRGLVEAEVAKAKAIDPDLTLADLTSRTGFGSNEGDDDPVDEEPDYGDDPVGTTVEEAVATE